MGRQSLVLAGFTGCLRPHHPRMPAVSICARGTVYCPSRLLRLAALLLVLLAPRGVAAEPTELGLRVPDGFEVTEYADSKLANDIYCMTLDPQGRVVVSGRGYVRILVDDDGDGRCDRAVEFADGPPDGAMGMLWEGTTLFFTGDGGLRRYRDQDRDGRVDGPSELIRAMRTGGEHDAHAIRRGADGWLYVMCGNMAGIDRSFAQLSSSPILDPVGGCVLRFTPNLELSEIVADGFRNAYDMAFGPHGELFTYDSDNERCVSLPWYEPTRFYHVLSGGHYGWWSPQQAQWWRLPPYAPDCIAPVANLHRGSPTGVEYYGHWRFPQRYHGGIFAADWTFGRIYFLPLVRSGASFSSKPELFLEAVGDNGFAPTDLVVHPETGDLFISVGGRGTRGAVFRVRYTARLNAPAAQARALLQPAVPKLEWDGHAATDLLRRATAPDPLERLHALEYARRHAAHLAPAQLQAIVRANGGHPDRYLRRATAQLIRIMDDSARDELAAIAAEPRAQLTIGFGSFARDATRTTALATRLLAPSIDPGLRCAAVRLLQLAWGDLSAQAERGTIWEGYSARFGRPVSGTAQTRSPAGPKAVEAETFERAVAALSAGFPSGDPALDRELARTLAMIEHTDAAVMARVAACISDTSDPIDDIHYLAVLARLRGPRSTACTRQSARALLALDRKVADRSLNRDRHWPLRVGELHAELAAKDPAINAAMLTDAEFGRPDHALFAQCATFDRVRAAELLLARAVQGPDYLWDASLVDLVGNLSDQRSFPVLREQWGNHGLREAILRVLARNPQAADRDKFLDGLSLPQLATVELCLSALDRLPPVSDARTLIPLIRALRRLRDGPQEESVAARIADYLQRVTGDTAPALDAQHWTEWFVQRFPEQAMRLAGPDGVDLAGWQRRLQRVEWASGDPVRGRRVYQQAGCAACHSGLRALGPDLRGVAQRFSREDLFIATVAPSRDVSPRYQTTLAVTEDGKVYQGSVIYEAVDSLILQTGPESIVRIANSQITERRATQSSLMPSGLLDELGDGEIADLYAYLKSLR